jgi:hypothetical protein
VKAWTWGTVPQGTPWDARAWLLLNGRMQQLEELLGALSAAAGVLKTAADGDTAPNASRCRVLVLANTGATAITALVGEPRQLVVVHATDAHTTLVHSAGLALAGSVNWTTAAGQARLFTTDDGASWYEVPR